MAESRCPPKYVVNTEFGIASEVTSGYVEWESMNMALLSLLLATLTDEAMEYVLGCKTAFEAWNNLVDRYASVSKSKVNHLKTELHTIQNGTDTVDKYLLRLKSIRDQLTAVGELLSDNDIIIAGLAGLPKEYSVIRTVILARESSITLKEFRAQLLGAEKEIEGEINLLSQNMSALYVNGMNSSGIGSSSGSGSTSHPAGHSHIPSTIGGTITQSLYPGTAQPFLSVPQPYLQPFPQQFSQPFPPDPSTFYPPSYGFGFMSTNTGPRPQFGHKPFHGSSYKGNTNFKLTGGYKGKSFNSGSSSGFPANTTRHNGSNAWSGNTNTRSNVDKKTRETLYHRKSRPRQLFQIPVVESSKGMHSAVQQSSGFLGQMVKSSIWHQRMGHPTNEIIAVMLKQSGISVDVDDKHIEHTLSSEVPHHVSGPLHQGSEIQEFETQSASTPTLSTPSGTVPLLPILDPAQLQAPQAWNSKFTSFLLALGFQTALSDSSLFVKVDDGDVILLLLYVDDIILTGSSSCKLQSVINNLAEVFELKDMGRLTYFLGLQIHYNSDGSLLVTQSKYAKELLKKAGMKTCKSTSTSSKRHSPLLVHEGNLLADHTHYRSLVGALQYLTFTRPDITYSVNVVCQYMTNSTDMHMHLVKRILRYLQGTLDCGLTYTRTSDFNIATYSDSDWAADTNTQRSITGFVVFLRSNPISWQSKKQATISRSSTEAEYKALAHCASDVYWIRSLLKYVHQFLPLPPKLHCDNLSALALCSNPVFHSRIKHLDTDFHIVQEKVQKGDITVQYVPTEEQVADVFTKGLHSPIFVKHCLHLTLGAFKTRGLSSHQPLLANESNTAPSQGHSNSQP
ncbi:uncharacterized protein [Pyrus communis]|uniref:uncharacterized protein n=1 Tax=Pyrus communis TaxID=23211 RepID=UPI0035C021AD